MLFIVLITMALVCTIANEIWTGQAVGKYWYLGFDGKSISAST